ncbi:MAG: NapC/NirT family cytochrome c [Planctomycetes bacterium]|nr:NapC/NirT family cytochrome c [Planctomycetota bacterium]
MSDNNKSSGTTLARNRGAETVAEVEDVPVERGGQPASPVKRKPLWNNVITITGLVAAQITLVLLLTFWLFTLASPTSNPYVDIVGHMILPMILIVSLAITPFGVLFKSWRLRRKDPSQRLMFRFPRIDLNDAGQRRIAKFVLLGTFVLLPVVGVSSYHGYHYTDSVDFCAKACHSVMEPQATTYNHSAHARVPCAECHIGPGASWFVRSKLSGTRQVLAVWQQTFSRPIPPAIRHLRPARETCEQCHWPKKFFGAQLREITYYSSDEANTRHDIGLLLKTGGGDDSVGRAEGIHMHMALAGKVEYIATDDRLQVIPWVRMVDRAGVEVVYRSDGRPSSDPRPEGALRVLDCMDCHNRPAHEFRTPQESVDLYLSGGRIDATLPFIKRVAVAALSEAYADLATAEAKIGAALVEYYRTNHPDLMKSRIASIHQAVDQVRSIYRQNFFPAMRVDWRTYPDNIGHFASPGCFRCHDGKHVSQRGEAISHRCEVCHDFLTSTGEPGSARVVQRGGFTHPFELLGPHAAARCDQCHTGGIGPARTCVGCHTDQAAFRAATSPAFSGLGIAPDAMAKQVDCEACHDASQPASVAAIQPKCMECHEDEAEKYEGMLTSWASEMEGMLRSAESTADEAGKRLLEALRRAGPLHNVEAARIIARAAAVGGASAQAPVEPARP